MWFGVYDPVTGELRSIGTEAMFVERARPKGDEYNGLRIAEFGDDRPDLSLVEWDASTRQMRERPPQPPPKSEADLLMDALVTEQAWAALSRSQQTAMETAIRAADERKHEARQDALESGGRRA